VYRALFDYLNIVIVLDDTGFAQLGSYGSARTQVAAGPDAC